MNNRRGRLRGKDLRRTRRGEETTGRARVRDTGKEVRRETRPLDDERVRTTERHSAPRTEERPRYEAQPRTQRRTHYEDDRRRRGGVPWWVWLLGLLALGLIGFMIFAGLTGDSEAGSAGTAAEGAGAAPAEGTVSAEGTDLLPIASSDGDLTQYEGRSVEARSVPVESVVSDEGFWVGNSVEERVFVRLALEGESGPDVDAGDRVDLSGTMTSAPDGFAESLGVTPEEGADQLEQQGTYIEANEIEEAA